MTDDSPSGVKLARWRGEWQWSPTPTGTVSGTPPSRPSGCGWSSCSTTCSPGSRPTRRTHTSCSTARWRWSTTTSPSDPRPRSGSAVSPRAAASRWAPGTSSWTSSSSRARRSSATCSSASTAPPPSAARWRSGYLPDMFGHIAQMPQILRQFGFDRRRRVARACRATSSARRSGGRAPTAAAVRAEYLPTGYGNGAVLPDDAKGLIERLHGWIEAQQSLIVRRRSDPLHERHRPPRTSGLARSASSPRRTRCRTSSTSRSPRWPSYLASASRVGTADVAGRAALGRARQPPHGRRLEPGRRAACRCGHRAVARAPGRAAERAAAPARRVARTAFSTRRGSR